MNSRLFPAVIFALAFVVLATPALAQEPVEDDPLADEGEVEETWDSYKVKAYTVQVFGGLFGGDDYLNLPLMDDQTYVEEGTQRVMSFDGSLWELDELDYTIYDAPIKEIEDGVTGGVRVGTYLSESFHLDLVFSYTRTEAYLSMINQHDEENPVREEIDRDDNVQIMRGALEMMYDINDVDIFGIKPYLGFGFGGVITSFSNLEDVGGLFLIGSAGLRRHFSDNVSAFAQFDLTSYSMSREELHYDKTVTYTDISVGLSFFVDVVPADVRARHEAELAEED
ncbi:hypothetical protein GF314_06985 [bacterium]|nr:hypothetical protein [bacterium]